MVNFLVNYLNYNTSCGLNEMTTTIKITEEKLKTLHEWMESTPQVEVCGLIGGRWRNQIASVDSVVWIQNIDALPALRFTMSPSEQLKAMLEFEKHGLELVGIFHSHPHGPASPSPTDIAEANYTEVVYLIGVPNGEIAAWRIRRGSAEPVQIQVVT
jgi:proteasome lid subunit RPN8/RPN11